MNNIDENIISKSTKGEAEPIGDSREFKRKLNDGVDMLFEKKVAHNPDNISEILKGYMEAGLIHRKDLASISAIIDEYAAEVGKGIAQKIALDMLDFSLGKAVKGNLNITDYPIMLSEMYKKLDQVKSREDLEKTAAMFFDLDGLKSVNDNTVGELEGHKAGDEYLRRAAEVFTNGRTAKWLNKMGIEYLPVHRSGDEFLCLISAGFAVTEKPEFKGIDGEAIDTAFVEYIVKNIEEDVSKIETEDIFNFENKEQRRKFYRELKNIKNDLGLGGIEDEDELERAIDEKLKDFKYKAGASGGWASFADGFVHPGKDEKIDPGELPYEEFVNLLYGRAIHVADKRMDEHKKEKRKERKEGSETDIIQEAIYRAGRSVDEEKIANEAREALIKGLEENILKAKIHRESIEKHEAELNKLEEKKDEMFKIAVESGVIFSKRERKEFRKLQEKIQEVKNFKKQAEDSMKFICGNITKI